MQFIWQRKLFTKPLYTTDKLLVEVLSPGTLNIYSGPDFSHAKLRIDNIIWVGNVKLHLKEKDWFNHNNHHDAQYDNIILHVICEKETSKNLTGHRTLNLYPSIK